MTSPDLVTWICKETILAFYTQVFSWGRIFIYLTFIFVLASHVHHVILKPTECSILHSKQRIYFTIVEFSKKKIMFTDGFV
jgi:hypothetical protein